MANGTGVQSIIKCPFYITDKTQPPYLCCEGLMVGNTIAMRFKNKDYKNEYIECFCANDYEKCKIYKVINEKYEEADDD